MRVMHLIVAALSVFVAAGGNAAWADPPLNIRMGWVVAPPELVPVLFAQDGVAKHLNQSYTFEATHFQGTPAMITALAADQLDIVPFTYPTLGTAIENAGMSDVRILIDEFQDGVPGYFTEPYMVLKDSGIHKVEDLKGKVIATNAIGSGVDIAMRVMLKKHGLIDQRDYSVVEVSFPNMKSMLLSGKTSLIIATVQTAFDPEMADKARILFTEREAVGPTEFSFWAARTGYIQAHRAVLVDFLEDSLRALRWYLDPKNHDQAVQIMADFIKQPPERFAGWFMTKKDQYRNPDGLLNLTALQHNLDAAQEMGFLKDKIDVTQYTDLSLVKEAAARLKH